MSKTTRNLLTVAGCPILAKQGWDNNRSNLSAAAPHLVFPVPPQFEPERQNGSAPSTFPTRKTRRVPHPCEQGWDNNQSNLSAVLAGAPGPSHLGTGVTIDPQSNPDRRGICPITTKSLPTVAGCPILAKQGWDNNQSNLFAAAPHLGPPRPSAFPTRKTRRVPHPCEARVG